MSRRTKLILLGLLVLLAIIITTIAAVSTIRAIQQFREQRTLIQTGDVRSIAPWMTIPYIAHTYNVPENYLYQWLHIYDSRPPRRTTLRALADHYNERVDTLIHTLQDAILTYRRYHPQPNPPPPPPIYTKIGTNGKTKSRGIIYQARSSPSPSCGRKQI